ncbi:MAG: ATP-binding protein [Bacteroidota bacterium]
MTTTPNPRVFNFLLTFLREFIRFRLDQFLERKSDRLQPELIIPDGHPRLTAFIKQHQPKPIEFISLLVAMAPHLQADFYDEILQEYFPDGNQFPAFGGQRGVHSRTILPTGETLVFLLAGRDIGKRMAVEAIFRAEHFFTTQRILNIGEVQQGEPRLGGLLTLDPEWLEKMLVGKVAMPHFSSHFPAERLTTELDWQDLILAPATKDHIDDILIWLEHHQTLNGTSSLRRHLKPGYRALFHGPPGTGKTLTATLLGKATNCPVFRVDLSMVVSKYIGETEKNLANLFDRAANKDWILFFDEADALFGKRTEVRDARDKSANQEVSFLLQRVESFPGLVILATNFLKNLDDAFHRRFQSVIHFPGPRRAERLLLWSLILPKEIGLSKDIVLEDVAAKYELTGAQIVNIVQYAALQLMAQGKTTLDQALLQKAIGREFAKEGKLRV